MNLSLGYLHHIHCLCSPMDQNTCQTPTFVIQSTHVPAGLLIWYYAPDDITQR